MKLTISGTVKEVADAITVQELIELEQVETPEYAPRSMKDEGQQVLLLREQGDGTYRMLVRKLEE